MDSEPARPPRDTDSLLGPPPPDPTPWYRLLQEFASPTKIKHPLDEPVLISVLRSGLCYLLGLLISVPVILLLFLFVLLTLPLRILWYLFAIRFLKASAPKDSLSTILFKAWTRCDSAWPLSGSGRTLKSGSLANGSADGRDSSSSSPPVQATSVAHCLVTLQGSLDVVDVREILYHKVVEAADPASGRLLFPRFSQRIVRSCQGAAWLNDVCFNVANHVTLFRPNRADNQVQTLDDLEGFLNQLADKPLSLSRPLWEVLVLADFGDTRCTLLVFRLHSLLTETLCLPRLLCRLNDSDLAFVNEPRLDPSFYQRVWGVGQMLSLSMMELPQVFFRKPKRSVWAHMREINVAALAANIAPLAPQQSAGDSAHRPVSVATNCSNASNSNASCPRKSPSVSLPPLPRVHHVLTWARVPNVDQLLRAEKLLHCSVEELFLSFIAGAYNRHLKNAGVRHPPDIYASLPVSLDKWGCSSPDRECCQCLVPVRLPVSVEGAIPRLWEVQKCLEDALDGSLPYSLFSLAYALEHSFLPASLATSVTKRVLTKAHSASGCVVTFLRGSLGSAAAIPPPTPNRSSQAPGLFGGMLTGGGTSFTPSGGPSGGRSEFSLKQHRIHSALFFQPLPAHVNASFTFVVFGREILLSLCTDSSVFPSADALLVSFQDQIQKLLRQISGRMISPIAAQLIAAAKPIIAAVSTSSSDSEVSEENSSGEEEIYHPAKEQQDQGGGDTRRKEQATPQASVDVDFVSAASANERENMVSPTSVVQMEELASLAEADLNSMTIEQLQNLLVNVQTELERLKGNSRSKSLVRLACLESRMEALQSKLAEALASPVARNGDATPSSFSVSSTTLHYPQIHSRTVDHSVIAPEPKASPPGYAPARSLSMPHPLLRTHHSNPAIQFSRAAIGRPLPVNMLEAFMNQASQDGTTRRHSFDEHMTGRKEPFARLRWGRSRRLSSPQAVVNSLSTDDILHSPSI